MKLRKYNLQQIKPGMRVLMRVDVNVPIKNGRVQEGALGRLALTAPDVKRLIRRKAKVILVSHLGRPKGRVVKTLSLKPIANRFSKLLGVRVKLAPGVIGAKVEQMIKKMKPGDVLLLENVRFDPGEEKNSAAFAKELAKLGDIYINDAFGVCHRKHASVHAITRYLPSYAGRLVQEEVHQLSQSFAKPLIILIGGLKLETIVGLLEKLAPIADAVLVGGGVAISLMGAKYKKSFLVAGKKVPQAELLVAKRLLDKYGRKIYCPLDLRVSKAKKPHKLQEINAQLLKVDHHVFDIGPDTEVFFGRILQTAKSVVWNGPMGIIEDPKAGHGTEFVAKVISQLKKARTILGGGDTVTFVEKKGYGKGFTLLSTGGGAMLAFLAGELLPGLEVLAEED